VSSPHSIGWGAYTFENELLGRLSHEATFYMSGIRTRINMMAIFEPANKPSLLKAMQDWAHHASIVPTLTTTSSSSTPSSSPKSDDEKTSATSNAIVVASITPSPASPVSPSSVVVSPSSSVRSWPDSNAAWIERHEVLRATVFNELRECSLKSAVDNALFMGLFKSCQMFVPGCFIGSQSMIKSTSNLDAYGITHVLSCNGTVDPFKGRYGWCTLKMDDIEQQELGPWIDLALDFIDYGRRGQLPPSLAERMKLETKLTPPKRPSSASSTRTIAPSPCAPLGPTPLEQATNNKRGIVLIHCSAGISRSAAISIAWLMKQGENGDGNGAPITLERCLRMMEAARPIINPNPSFRKQLEAMFRKWNKKSASSAPSSTDMAKC